jgi:hypothetical protein
MKGITRMGRGSNVKESAQAITIFPSRTIKKGAQAGTGGSGSSSGSSNIEQFVINLIHLNLGVLNKVKVGESVTVDATKSPFHVRTKYGRLGDIPQRKEQVVKQSGLTYGFVHSVSTEPPQASVALQR